MYERVYLAPSKNLAIIGPLLKERALIFVKELGHNNLYLFFLQIFHYFVDEGCEIACNNDACFNEAEREESTVEPDLRTAIVSRQEAWNKTFELLF